MSLQEFLAQFDSLPNDAIAPDRFAAAILGVSVWTLRREDPVPPRQITERRRGRRVGNLRALMRGETIAPAHHHHFKPKPTEVRLAKNRRRQATN
jgi:hypothetical protein